MPMSISPIDRRTWLRGLFGGSAALGLHAAWGAKQTDAAQVSSKDNIKVTKIETFVLKNSWVFVKVSTDAGITGWGEMLKDDAKACAAGALEVGDYLIGQDPRRVVFHWQAIHRGAFYRGGPIKTAISSGIDQALWDITGKAYGVPVYKLMGGPTRDRVRVYGSPNPDQRRQRDEGAAARHARARRSSTTKARRWSARSPSGSRRCARRWAPASTSASSSMAPSSRRRRWS